MTDDVIELTKSDKKLLKSLIGVTMLKFLVTPKNYIYADVALYSNQTTRIYHGAYETAQIEGSEKYEVVPQKQIEFGDEILRMGKPEKGYELLRDAQCLRYVQMRSPGLMAYASIAQKRAILLWLQHGKVAFDVLHKKYVEKQKTVERYAVVASMPKRYGPKESLAGALVKVIRETKTRLYVEVEELADDAYHHYAVTGGPGNYYVEREFVTLDHATRDQWDRMKRVEGEIRQSEVRAKTELDEAINELRRQYDERTKQSRAMNIDMMSEAAGVRLFSDIPES